MRYQYGEEQEAEGAKQGTVQPRGGTTCEQELSWGLNSVCPMSDNWDRSQGPVVCWDVVR